jgi:hypothetical protein
MPCCGKGREQIRNQIAVTAPAAADTGAQLPRRAYLTNQRVEYRGASSVTLASPVTGRRYRFEHKGAQMDIDPRDRAWLASQPNVRQVG